MSSIIANHLAEGLRGYLSTNPGEGAQIRALLGGATRYRAFKFANEHCGSARRSDAGGNCKVV
jgi:hypothetical protein